jgi:hypothetical protein
MNKGVAGAGDKVTVAGSISGCTTWQSWPVLQRLPVLAAVSASWQPSWVRSTPGVITMPESCIGQCGAQACALAVPWKSREMHISVAMIMRMV